MGFTRAGSAGPFSLGSWTGRTRKSRSPQSAQAGFTLVEVAIVVVIVGLLLATILKGQEMIAQAKVKRAISDFTGTFAAYYGYRDRFHALPGDDPNAGRWTGATPGNGDGVVAGAYDSSIAGVESRLWWDHVRRAGFVGGSGEQQPRNPQSGIVGVQFGDAAGGTTLGGFSHLIACSTNLPDKVAAAVDVQIDDGAGDTGKVRALAQSGSKPVLDAAAAPAAYVETGANLYTVCREMP